MEGIIFFLIIILIAVIRKQRDTTKDKHPVQFHPFPKRWQRDDADTKDKHPVQFHSFPKRWPFKGYDWPYKWVDGNGWVEKNEKHKS